jgi:hypothetical protein
MLFSIAIRAASVHTVTYFLVGFAAFTLFHYQATLVDPSNNFRPATDPLVRAGVLFQPIRRLSFGMVFYLLRSVLFQQSTGWLITWVMLVAVGIFSTFAPAGGSIEGFIYFKPTSGHNWGGLAEILTQSLLLSVLTYVWVNHPNSLWMNWVFGILFGIALLLPALGLLGSRSRPAAGSPLQPKQQEG